eukprot:g5569.t1
MWNLESFTHQLGDAFQKVRKEVEAFGVVEEPLSAETPTSSPIQDEPKLDVSTTQDSVSPPALWVTPAMVSLSLDVLESESRCRVRLLVNETCDDTKLSELLMIREQQLQQQSQKLLQLQERNEVLERTALSISKEEYETRCLGYEERLLVAENRIYTLSKERDNLLQSSQSQHEKDQIIKEKDEMIEEIMAEGQRLSMKQMDLESLIRKKSARIKELESDNEGLKSKLMMECSNSEKLMTEKDELKQTIDQLEVDYKNQISTLQSEFEKCLKDNSAAKAQAENEAQQKAKEALLQRAVDAENKTSSLMNYIKQLETELETQNHKSEELEMKYNKEFSILEDKCHEAEIRYEELSAKFPEATQPLLQQLEALQFDLDSKTEDWTLAEKSLLEQLDQMNRDLQTAQQKEQNLQKKLEILTEKFQQLNQSNESSKLELQNSLDRIEKLKLEVKNSKGDYEKLSGNFENYKCEMEEWKSDQHQLQERLQSDLSTEKTAKLSVEMKLKHFQIEHQKQVADLEDQIKQKRQQQQWQDEERNESSNFRRQQSIDEISVVSETTNSVELLSSKSLQSSKDHQIERLNKQIKSLENTRDHLSSEMVLVSQRAMRAEASLADFQNVKAELVALQTRYDSAIELLGEREEQVEELKADLEDFKQMYRDQITYVAEQLSSSTS